MQPTPLDDLFPRSADALSRDRPLPDLRDDPRHLERRARIDTAAREPLHPKGIAAPVVECAGPDAARDLQEPVARLEAAGVETFAPDPTRPQFEIPVVRVFRPQLQLDPSPLATERLPSAMKDGGNSNVRVQEAALF